MPRVSTYRAVQICATTAEYGTELVCIRHRIDPTGTKRFTTVELVVSEKLIARKLSPTVGISVRVQERDLQTRLKMAGAKWDKTAQVWRVRRATAVALGLKKRIVP